MTVWSMCQQRKPRLPAQGRVKIQAITRFLARLQRTAESRWVDPTPKSDDDMVCEVLMGAPKTDALVMTILAAHSAVKP